FACRSPSSKSSKRPSRGTLTLRHRLMIAPPGEAARLAETPMHPNENNAQVTRGMIGRARTMSTALYLLEIRSNHQVEVGPDEPPPPPPLGRSGRMEPGSRIAAGVAVTVRGAGCAPAHDHDAGPRHGADGV